MKVYFTAFLVSIFLSSSAFAHGGEKHGSGIESIVETVSVDQLVVKSEDKSYVVKVLPETKIKTDQNNNDNISAIKAGSKVHVEGSKLTTSEIAASEIHIEATSSENGTKTGDHR